MKEAILLTSQKAATRSDRIMAGFILRPKIFPVANKSPGTPVSLADTYQGAATWAHDAIF
jgi:hypothetical protein